MKGRTTPSSWKKYGSADVQDPFHPGMQGAFVLERAALGDLELPASTRLEVSGMKPARLGLDVVREWIVIPPPDGLADRKAQIARCELRAIHDDLRVLRGSRGSALLLGV